MATNPYFPLHPHEVLLEKTKKRPSPKNFRGQQTIIMIMTAVFSLVRHFKHI